jgi:hypothetical protein
MYFDDFIYYNEAKNDKKTQICWQTKHSIIAFVYIFVGTIFVIKIRVHNDYSVNQYKISFKISLCIFVFFLLKWGKKWYKK